MDKVVSAQGTYNATAGNSGGAWAMQMVAFKAATGTSDTTAPTIPAGLSATAISSSQINLAWTASTDVDNASSQLTYGIYRNNIKIATTTAGITSWNDAGLAASTTYAYAVNAQDPAGNASAQSASVNATTLPAAPPIISVFGANPASIIAGQTTTLYWVVSNTTSLAVGQGIGVVTGGTSAIVRPATTTIYTLTASNNAGSTTAQTTVMVSPDTEAPTVHADLAAAAVSSSQINLAWNASTDNVAVTGYQIYRNGLQVGTTTAGTYSDSGLAANTTYTYAVAAFDAAGNVSALSAEASATTPGLSPGNYATTFPLAEDPISEGGNWINGGTVGLDWANIRTTPGLAYSASGLPSEYGDPTAVLAGTWGPTQTVSAVVKIGTAPSGGSAEVELRLRSSISAHSCTGYEFNYSIFGEYAQIVRWNGALGSFTYIGNSGPNGALATGDVLKAAVTNNTFYFYRNGSLLGTATDSTFTGGSPGMGFYPDSSTLNWGFSSFTASDGSAPDTQAPTAPTDLAATVVSPSQINLAWTASTDNVGVAGYQIYRNGVEVGTTSATMYSDTGLAANTTYTYAIAAFDAAGNVSAPSATTSATTPSPDTTPPSVPSDLQLLNVASTSATIAWSPSTDNVSVAGYLVFRNGNQVGTTTSTNYTDTGLAPSTLYIYTVAAYDTSTNVSAQSGPLEATTTAAPSTPPSFVQVNNNQIASGTSTSVSFKSPTKAGNTIVAYVIWSNTGTVALSDTSGDTFVSSAPPVMWGASYQMQVFYAANIAGGADTLTATFQSAVSSFGVLYIHEYSGIDPLNPVDATVSASGASGTLNSGNALTTYPNDLLFGAGVSDNIVTAAGSGFTARDTAYGNITEDRIAASTGSYSATASQNGSAWGMQLIAFRSAK